MRILMVTDFYHPYVGGVEQYVRSLGAGLVRRGHEVAVATLWSEGLDDEEMDGGVRVYRLRGAAQRVPRLFGSSGRKWAPPIPDPAVVAGLRRVLDREQPDIVHGHDWLARSFLPLKAHSGARFVMSLHYYTVSCAKKTMILHDEACSGPGLLKCLSCAEGHYGVRGAPITLANWSGAAAERRLVDAYIPVSGAVAELNGLPDAGVPFTVIPNFLPDDIDTRADPHAPVLSVLPDGDFLLFVGWLQPYKGLHVLLDAYAGLRDAPPLVVIGPQAPEANLALPSNVVVAGGWPHAAIMEAWKRCAVAVAPAVWPEPCATVVLEAMVSGRPVVASRIGGMPEMVADGRSGFLVPPGDVFALRAALARLIEDRTLRERMGQAGRARSARFRAESVVPRIAHVYRQVLAPGVSALDAETIGA